MDAVVAALRAGAAVILPTDTVYGLACRADDEDAVHALLALKGRRLAQPTALVAASVDALPELDTRSVEIAGALLPGPYTLVLPNPRRLYPWLAGSRGDTLGVRVPVLSDEATRAVAAVGAVAATSANAHGGPDPATVYDVPREIRDACAAILDVGALPGTPSTVLDFTGDEPRVLREGAAPSAEALARVRTALA